MSASEQFSGPLMKVLWKAMMVAGYDEIHWHAKKKGMKIIFLL